MADKAILQPTDAFFRIIARRETIYEYHDFWHTAKHPDSNPADCSEVKLSLSVFIQNMKND